MSYVLTGNAQASGLGFSLKPPKALRKLTLGKVLGIATTAAALIPGVGTAIAAAGKLIPGAATAIKLATAAKALPGIKTASTLLPLAKTFMAKPGAAPMPVVNANAQSARTAVPGGFVIRPLKGREPGRALTGKQSTAQGSKQRNAPNMRRITAPRPVLKLSDLKRGGRPLVQGGARQIVRGGVAPAPPDEPVVLTSQPSAAQQAAEAANAAQTQPQQNLVPASTAIAPAPQQIVSATPVPTPVPAEASPEAAAAAPGMSGGLVLALGGVAVLVAVNAFRGRRRGRRS